MLSQKVIVWFTEAPFIFAGRSIFGDKFNDEDFTLSHRSAGWVAMANHGPDTNGSQFYILLTKARWLDGKHVVFGKVIRGFDVVETLGNVPSDPNTAEPKKTVKIIGCGVNKLDKKYDLAEDQLDSTEDLWGPRKSKTSSKDL